MFFSCNETATTEIYTLSLHDALPILALAEEGGAATMIFDEIDRGVGGAVASKIDRKSTRLNSSHVEISYAVFCLKKKSLDARLWAALPSRQAGQYQAQPSLGPLPASV